MKITPSYVRRHKEAKPGIFLLVVAFLVAMTGYGGTCGTYNATPSEDLEIWDWYDLDAVRDNLAGNHKLMNSLNSTTPGYTELASPTANQGQGWEPIGSGYWASGPPSIRLVGEVFNGSFDGQGYEISDLFINRSGWGGSGLFGCVGRGGIIRNLGVTNATVTVPEDVDSLVRFTGGTVDTLDVATIDAVGILVGFSRGSVSDSYASGTVSGDTILSGLVGRNTGTVSNSYSTGNVTGNGWVGGLVAVNGEFYFSGTVSNSFSIGNVTGYEYVGGLVGNNEYTGAGVDYCGTVTNCFWDIESSGQITSDGGTGKTTAEMKGIITFLDADWNIIAVTLNETNPAYIWNIVNNVTYPFLSWQS